MAAEVGMGSIVTVQRWFCKGLSRSLQAATELLGIFWRSRGELIGFSAYNPSLPLGGQRQAVLALYHMSVNLTAIANAQAPAGEIGAEAG